MIRIFIGVFVFSCILFGYWWLTLCLSILLLFYFKTYYEILLFGIIYDSIYGLSLPEFWNIRYIFTLTSVVLFIISLMIKKRLIIYES